MLSLQLIEDLQREDLNPIEVRGKGHGGTPTVRERTQLYGETQRQHLSLPSFQPEVPETR